MSYTSSRHNKCFSVEDTDRDRLTFPRFPRPNTITYDAIENFCHVPISIDENYSEYSTEMKSEYVPPKLSNYKSPGARKSTLEKFFWRHLTKGNKLSMVPEFEEYNTEYTSNYSVDMYKNLSENLEMYLKHPISGRSDVTTTYTKNCICNNKRNILEPFKKTCHFSKPLEDRM